MAIRFLDIATFTGNVGIGTTTTTAARLVVDSDTAPQILVKNSGGGNAKILFEDNSGSTQNASITFDQAGQNTTTVASGFQSSSNTNRINIAPAGHIALTATGGSGGIAEVKVGIGTTTPETKLDVNGIISLGGAKFAKYDSTNDLFIVGDLDAAGAELALNVDAGEAVRINAAGALKFNTYGAGTLRSDASGNITSVTSGAGTGTVTSVNFKTDGTALNVASNTITGTGTMTGVWQGTASEYVNGLGDRVTFPTIPQGDITGVTAGTGMTGGGTSGTVTLNVIGGDGITANADNIVVDSTVVRTSGTQIISGRITANGGINGLTLGNGGISGSNYNISGVNQLQINDPGEGIIFGGGASGSITLALIDDAADNILNLNAAAAFKVNAKITNLTNPTAAQDAATKAYVDTNFPAKRDLENASVWFNVPGIASTLSPRNDGYWSSSSRKIRYTTFQANFDNLTLESGYTYYLVISRYKKGGPDGSRSSDRTSNYKIPTAGHAEAPYAVRPTRLQITSLVQNFDFRPDLYYTGTSSYPFPRPSGYKANNAFTAKTSRQNFAFRIQRVTNVGGAVELSKIVGRLGLLGSRSGGVNPARVQWKTYQ